MIIDLFVDFTVGPIRITIGGQQPDVAPEMAAIIEATAGGSFEREGDPGPGELVTRIQKMGF